ncbi:MAG: helix-turn-helix domain-containing protein [Promethearchaeota archaeon]
MSDIKLSNMKDLFKTITDNLIQMSNGTFIFKNKTYQLHSRIIIGPNLREDPKCIPSEEELCDYFENEIVSKIPHAILYIYGELSIEVNIDPKNKYKEQFHLAQKELDIYESVRTLFFPTMKDIVIKRGNSAPRLIYNYNRKYEVERDRKGIFFRSPSSKIYRGIAGTAIDFLREDLDFFFSNFKFKNPTPIYTVNLPQADITLDALLNGPKRKRKGYKQSELYSISQKIKFLKKIMEDFLEYYPKLIIDNFPRIRNSFFLYSKQPIKITAYTQKYYNNERGEDVKVLFIYESLNEEKSNEFKLIEEEIGEYYPAKHLYAIQYSSINSFIEDSILLRTFITSDNVLTSEIYSHNALPITYDLIRKELDDILEMFSEDSIFDEIKPFEPSVEQWIKTILDAEEKGGEDYNIEFKSIPNETTKGDGSGNDIYGHINSFENAGGGYIFIGIDESKKSTAKIIGLEPYLNQTNKTLDQLKREIRQRCFNYLGKDNYRIDSRIYKGKSIIRIKISSNFGDISWFKTSDGSLRVYMRKNGEKKLLSPSEIDARKQKN